MAVEQRAVMWLEEKIAKAERRVDYWVEIYGGARSPRAREFTRSKINEAADRLEMLQYLSALAVDDQSK